MTLIVLAVLALASVFVAGLVRRRRAWLLVGSPGPILLVVWYLLASARPDPQEEFDLRFGADNRPFVSDIRTIKPIMMDGHFISFHISPADFDSRIGPGFSTYWPLQTPTRFLVGQRLPEGWPPGILTKRTALYRVAGDCEVLLLYFREEQRAYASVRYDQW